MFSIAYLGLEIHQTTVILLYFASVQKNFFVKYVISFLPTNFV